MYWHEIPDEGYQLTLGPWSFAPPPPTWREFFVSEGIPHRTDQDVQKICSSHCIEPGDFDKPVQRRYWGDWFDITGGPLARAFTCSKKSISALSATLGADRSSSSTWGAIPATAPHYVNAKDMLSLSLLQARLIDLKLPIKIVEGE